MTTPPMPEPQSLDHNIPMDPVAGAGLCRALSVWPVSAAGEALTPFQGAIAAVLWRAGYDTADIAHALRLPEAVLWNALSAIREAQFTCNSKFTREVQS